MGRVAIMGAAVVDNYVVLDEFPEEDSIAFALESFRCPGGRGLNVALNLAIRGVEVDLHCALGSDENGEKLYRVLREHGITPKIRWVERTAETLILVDSRGNRRIISLNGPPPKYSTGGGYSGGYDVIVVLESQPDEAEKFLKGLEGFKVFSPGGCVFRFGVDLTRYLASLADLTFLSRVEADFLKDFQNLSEYVIVTRGKEPTLVFRKGVLFVEIPTIETETVLDTTGAGDACLSGMVSALIENTDIPSAVMKGHEWASRVITSYCANLSGIRLDHIP